MKPNRELLAGWQGRDLRFRSELIVHFNEFNSKL